MTATAYQNLEDHFERVYRLRFGRSLLSCDNSTDAPKKSRPYVSEITSTLAGTVSMLLQDPKIGDWIESAKEDASLNDWRKRNLHLMEREYLEATAIPVKLTEEITRASGECYRTWEEARKNNDFAMVKDKMKNIIRLTVEVAQAKRTALMPEKSIYEVLLDDHDEGLTPAHINAVFDDLEAVLPATIDAIIEKQHRQGKLSAEGTFSVSSQEVASRYALEELGFDFGLGKYTQTTHPFCGGFSKYKYVAVRYQENEFWLEAYGGATHEIGHGTYEINLPEKYMWQPVGESQGMTLHESQSLMFERHISKNPKFIEKVLPQLKNLLGGESKDWTVDSILTKLNKVERSFVRVDADEVTYPLHVVMRYRLEQALISGDLAVEDLPGAWNEAIEKLLHISPPTDALGCLQDAHWYSAMGYGYFPTYSLGAMAAAQFFESAMQQADIQENFNQGNIQPLLVWLRENIHAKGRLKPAHEVIKDVTGQSLSTAAYKRYLGQKYAVEVT